MAQTLASVYLSGKLWKGTSQGKSVDTWLYLILIDGTTPRCLQLSGKIISRVKSLDTWLYLISIDSTTLRCLLLSGKPSLRENQSTHGYI